LFIPAADVPQIIAEYVMGQCELDISMTGPDNIAINDTDRFMIYIDDLNVFTMNNVTSISLPVSSCAIRNVSVLVVDHCGRESSSTVTVSQGQDCVCDTGHVNAAMGNSKYTIT
jgi:hypothetical protein